MQRNLLGFVTTIVVLGAAAAARAQVRTDYGAYPAPAVTPAAPAAGQTINDPVFGTKILRVTGPADGNDNITSYSYWPSFNRNSTFIKYYADGTPKLATFDPATMQLSNKRNLFLSNSPDGFKPVWDDVIWSGVDPDVIFGHTKMNMWAYNVRADQYTLVHNFANEFGDGHLQQMSKSIDDNVFAFTRQDPDYGKTGHVAWRRDTNQVRMSRTDASAINEIELDKTGRYVLIANEGGGAGHIQSRVVDLNTGGVTDLRDDGPHFAPGHGDLGRGISVAHENWNNRIMGRSLANPTQPYQIFQLPDWDQSQHVSLLADNEDWALVSNFGSGNGPFDNELFLVKTDGSGAVIRFAHHESDYNDYYDSPRADISRDGRWVTFTSNWGNANGRRDVFVAAVPQVPEPAAAGALLAPLALLLARRARRGRAASRATH